MRSFLIVAVLAFVGIVQSQEIVTDISGSVPNDAEIEEILASPETIKRMVDCILAREFDGQNCHYKLERAHRMAEDFFTRGNQCVSCTPYEEKQVNKFLNRLKSINRKEHRRLTQGILKKATEDVNYPDYY